jgi:hypothetical protein
VQLNDAISVGDKPLVALMEDDDGVFFVVWCKGKTDWGMPVRSVNEGRQIVQESLWGTAAIRSGYVLGVDAYGLDGIKKARKNYSCDGPLRQVRWEDNLSPATGDAVCDGPADGCTGSIDRGELYACLTLTDSDTREATGSYWNTHRTCLACAIAEWIIVEDKRSGVS